jgi:hypothetical protein
MMRHGESHPGYFTVACCVGRRLRKVGSGALICSVCDGPAVNQDPTKPFERVPIGTDSITFPTPT